MIERAGRVDLVEVVHVALGGGDDTRLLVPGSVAAVVLNEHFPVCGACGQLWPCVGHEAARVARVFGEEIERLCQHCSEPVLVGESVVEFEVVYRPGEALVVRFHQRPACRAAARAFEVEARERGELRRAA